MKRHERTLKAGLLPYLQMGSALSRKRSNESRYKIRSSESSSIHAMVTIKPRENTISSLKSLDIRTGHCFACQQWHVYHITPKQIFPICPKDPNFYLPKGITLWEDHEPETLEIIKELYETDNMDRPKSVIV